MTALSRNTLSKCLIAVLAALAVASSAQEPDCDWSKARELYPGIEHLSIRAEAPRSLNINCLRVDTHTPGLSFYTTPRHEPWEEDVSETLRVTTRQFMQQAREAGRPVVAAVNADGWKPWIPITWGLQMTTNVTGLAVSDGVLVSPAAGTPSLIVRKDGAVEMALTDATTDIETIHTAVSGFAFVLKDGEILPAHVDLHPRTGIGICPDARFVYLVTIDGRQEASGGATYEELAGWLRHFGACTGVNMDGGGSTTMAWWDPESEAADKSSLLNVPVGGGIPGTERCNGNNLGVCYEHGELEP